MKISVIFNLALNDLKSRYAGSLLGSLWAFIGTFMTICIYWFVYTFALKGGEVEGLPYIVWLLTGIIPWFFFAEVFTGTASCFGDYSFLVKKIRFKGEYLPLIRVISTFLIHIVFLSLVYIINLISGIVPEIGQLWIFTWILGGFLFNLGLGTVIALCCVRVRDMKYASGVIVQLGFWLTPVFWNYSSLPPKIMWITSFNPVAILVKGYRNALLFGEGIGLSEFIFFWGIVVFLNIAGIVLMKKLRPTIADYL